MSELNLNCFMCLKTTCSSTSALNEKREDLRKYLFPLENYVKIFPPETENNDGLGSIKICEGCRYLLERFSDLLKLLEIAEMKVDSCLKEIQDVMVTQKRSNGIQSHFNSKSENFRKDLIEKASSKLKRSRSQPIVKLQKTRINRVSTKLCSTVPTSPVPEVEDNVIMEVKVEEPRVHIDHFCDDDDDNDDGNSDTNEEPEVQLAWHPPELEDPLGDEEEEEATKYFVKRTIDMGDGKSRIEVYCTKCKLEVTHRLQHLQGFHQKSLTKEVPKPICCPYCRARFKKTYVTGLHKRRERKTYGTFLLRAHMLQYHGEHFFPTHRLESITEIDFQKIVVELLFKDLIEGRDSCAFCPRPIVTPSGCSKKNANNQRVKVHYLDNHYKKLEKILNDIQRDPNLREKLDKCNPKGRICNYCGTYTPSLQYSRSHTKMFCKFTEGIPPKPKKLFVPNVTKRYPVSQMEDMSKVKCNLCGIIINREYGRNHVLYFCKVAKKQRGKEPIREMQRRTATGKQKKSKLSLHTNANCDNDDDGIEPMIIGLD